nr:hypothetical protein GCM10020092_020780 [Actinoplanes digitatis]
MTRMFVDAWDPAYGASFEGGDSSDGPASPSSAQVDTDVEVPAAQWAPIDVAPGVRCPDVVFLVDGVRRNDAGLWTAEDDGMSYAGLAASYAAGVVRCDLGNGVAELVGARVGRGLFTASPSASDLQAGSVLYEVHRVSGTGEASKLPAAVQAPLTALEIDISGAARDGGSDGADLLVVDGPLRNRRQLPRTIGYVKTQQKQYLLGRADARGDVAAPRAADPGLPAGHCLGRLVLVPAAARGLRRTLVRDRPGGVLPGPARRGRRGAGRDFIGCSAPIRLFCLQGSAGTPESGADRRP